MVTKTLIQYCLYCAYILHLHLHLFKSFIIYNSENILHLTKLHPAMSLACHLHVGKPTGLFPVGCAFRYIFRYSFKRLEFVRLALQGAQLGYFA